uniref:RalA-binding protein 1 n=1 Tax=Kwoniella dejecticola CBS 10117 TaxID=1296121 RepID=A0A1A6ABJ0_9TREE|nr:uncharacterized protein I303_01620 [Kwoniella dejecticola CBS 10117]OBR87418.1 hypothetical protein I303_01620 [Kwoniella dejecticola CBS 10117]
MSPNPIPHRLNAPSSSHSSPKSSRSRPSPAGSPQSGQPSSPRASPRAGSSGTIDIDAVLRANGGDIRKALEIMVAERNNLQAQNTQLWKLIEKQRAQCATLASDNDRLRLDRERANEKLAHNGLEPIPSHKQIPNSSSAVGLGLKAEHPQIRRHNSDRDETPTKASVSKQQSNNTDSAPNSPAHQQPPSGLLPSPIPDKKLRRESKMTFPPEVSTFMTLADSPREATHTVPAMPPSNSFNTLSPASQYSASPSVNGKEETGVVPPPSSRALAVSIQNAEPLRSNEHLTSIPERPPPRVSSRSPLPDRESTKSPVQSMSDGMSATLSLEEPVRSSFDSSLHRKSHDTTPRQSLERQAEASHSKSSLTDQGRPRMTPALLPYSRITIPNSTVFPNSAGRDVLCFIVAVTARPPNAQPITWNVAKLFSAFLDLETRIKAKSGKRTKEWKQMIAPLPEGRAWKDFAPSKIDQRKSALETYLQSLLVAPISDKSDLCAFLNSDHVRAKAETARKEGYLTKKGKNFGGWKTRYFVLDGPVMEYYEQASGTHLGSIAITNAKIGRQNRPAESTDERNFRHAFLIIETTKRGVTNQHVLCAESDSERDSWIEMLVRYVGPDIPQAPAPPHQPATTAGSSSTPGLMRKRSQSRKGSKDVIVTAAQPMSSLGSDSKFGGAPSPSLINSMESQKAIHSSQSTSSQASNPSISTTSSGLPQTPTQDARPAVSQPIKSSHHSSSSHDSAPMTMVTSPSSDMLSSSPPTMNSDPTPRANKRQSMMPGRPSYSPAYLTSLSNQGLNAPPGLNAEKERDRKAKSRGFWGFGKTPEKISRPVFAVPLTDSIAIASVANLPAIVFRCIEWLEAKKAEQEEGIYRLSGSSAVIKGLKDRFDAEGDVNLVAVDEYWDPHAIAGLLKTFLRELPTSLLTRELHTRFLAVMDLIDSSARVLELSRLVSELPPPNYALLRALTAHLILIVKNATVNKMTLRNIGIVFSPTLGIPAGIFSELVSHFSAIFDDAPSEELVDEAPANPEEDMEETIKRKRNSMLYQAGGADAMLGLTARALDPANEDSASELSDMDSDLHSIPSSDNLSAQSHANLTPRPHPSANENYPSAAAARKAKAASRGLAVDIASTTKSNGSSHSHDSGSGSGSRTPGLPVSPKPPVNVPSPRKEREVSVS